jgi:hypothetical protein
MASISRSAALLVLALALALSACSLAAAAAADAGCADDGPGAPSAARPPLRSDWSWS